MNRAQRFVLTLGLMVAAAMLHFSYCEWERFGTNGSVGQIVGPVHVRDARVFQDDGTGSGVRSEAIWLGVALPIGLIIAGMVFYLGQPRERPRRLDLDRVFDEAEDQAEDQAEGEEEDLSLDPSAPAGGDLAHRDQAPTHS